jgi:outer membrane receptor protein involved in Fe transport
MTFKFKHAAFCIFSLLSLNAIAQETEKKDIAKDTTKVQLQEVFVQGKKKLVEKKIDRLIFNIENTISATGGDGLDALKITPGVKVQNDKVSIVGKGSVSLMVDDKLIQLKEEDLSNYLKSISSDNIKSIEVITTPPAKYDAIGNSGIINIKTKKGKKDSWSAALGTTYSQRSRADGAVFGNFNENKNGLTITSSFNYKNGSKNHNQDDSAYFPDGLWQTSSPFLSHYKRLSISLGLDYQIGKKWKTGILYMANRNQNKITDSPYTSVMDYNTGDILQYLKSDGNQNQKPNIHSINYFNEFKLDSLDRKLILNFDYFNFDNNDDKKYNGISIINNPFSQQYFAGANNNNQNIQNFSGKVDIEYPMKWTNLSFGGKITNSKAKNTITSFNSGLVNSAIVSQPLTSNLFEYDENIEALYLSSNKKINDKWETQLGIRMEATQTISNSLTLNQKTKNDYVKFFPSFFLSYKPNDKSTFNLNYSKRVDRPSFNDLNPNQWFINPFQTIEGNPFLQPAFIDNFEFLYSYNNLENKIYYSIENNLYGQIAVADPNTNEIIFTNENYVNTKRFGISENYTFDKLKWFTSNNSIDVSYVKSESFIAIIQRNQEGWNSRFSTNNDFILSKNKTKLFNINYWYSPKGIDGKFYNIGSMSNLSATFQYLLLDKNLKISLKANDIFRTEKIKVNSTVNNVYQEGVYYHDNQSLQLTLNYKFGNQKIKAVKRETGNEDERTRTGN